MGQKNSYVSQPIFSSSNTAAPPVPRAHKALLVGVSYKGKKDAELKGSPVDVRNMQHLLESQGFNTNGNTRVLLEDSNEDPPTKANIIRGVEWLTEGATPGDVNVLYLVGNGGDVSKLTNNKLKHRSEGLLPCDFNGTLDSVVLGNEVYRAASLTHGIKMLIVRDFSLPGSFVPLPFSHTWTGKYQVKEDPKLADAIDMDVQVLSVVSDKPQRLAPGMFTTALVEGFNSLSSKKAHFTYGELLQTLSGKYKSVLKGTHSTPSIINHSRIEDTETFSWHCADTQRGLSIPVGSKVTLYKLNEKELNGKTGILTERFTGSVAGIDIPGRDTPVNVLSKNMKLESGVPDIPFNPPAPGLSKSSKSSKTSYSDVGIVNDEIIADTKISRAANDNSNWVVTVRKEPESPLGLQLAHNLVLLGTDPNTPASESGVPHSVGRTLVSVNGTPVYNHNDVLRETIGQDVCTLEFSEKPITDLRTHSSVPNSTVIPPGTPTSDYGYYVASGVGPVTPVSHRTGYGRGRGRVVSSPSYDFAARPASPTRMAPPQHPHHPFVGSHPPVAAMSPAVTSPAFNERMESLQRQKQMAVASENYIEAKQLKAEIDRMTAEATITDGGGMGQRLPVVPLAERVVSLEMRLADTEAALAHREHELDRMRSSSPPPPPMPPSRVSYSRPSVVGTYSPSQQLPAPPPMVPMARIQSLSPRSSYRAGQRASISPPRPIRGEPYQQPVVPLVANQQLF